jgi:hypothetical protein
MLDDSLKPDRAKLSCHSLAPPVPEEGCGYRPEKGSLGATSILEGDAHILSDCSKTNAV